MKLKKILLSVTVILFTSSAVFAVENCRKRSEATNGDCESVSDKATCNNSYETHKRQHSICSWAYGNKCTKTTRICQKGFDDTSDEYSEPITEQLPENNNM